MIIENKNRESKGLNENKGLILLKKGQKGIFHAIFSRFGLILVLLFFQVLILFSIFRWFEEFLPHILGGTVLFTVVMVDCNYAAAGIWSAVIFLYKERYWTSGVKTANGSDCLRGEGSDGTGAGSDGTVCRRK